MKNQKTITQEYAKLLLDTLESLSTSIQVKLANTALNVRYLEPCFYRMQKLRLAKQGEPIIYSFGCSEQNISGTDKICIHCKTLYTPICQFYSVDENLTLYLSICMHCALVFLEEADNFSRENFMPDKFSIPPARIFAVTSLPGDHMPKEIVSSGRHFTALDTWDFNRQVLSDLKLHDLTQQLNLEIGNSAKEPIIGSYFDFFTPLHFCELDSDAKFLAQFDQTALPLICYADVLEEFRVYLFKSNDVITTYMIFNTINKELTDDRVIGKICH